MTFTLEAIADLASLAPHCPEQISADLLQQILNEAGRFAGEVIAPLNVIGDREGSRLDNGVVRTPAGFKEAFQSYAAGGWNGLAIDPEHGGQGLPGVVATAVQEMFMAANMGWSLGPLLATAAIEALISHGTEHQRQNYLPKLLSGEWTATMDLTEPQAGSDVGALRTRAVRDGDRYRITGQKIFITYGDHDWTDNIVHMVLARLPDAPSGSKGISLFIVPKVLGRPDGSPGERNDMRVVSLEHKLGINVSPTCVMAYGDNDGAIGELVGREHEGLACMFTMMNGARLQVGLQGVGIAERAYQQARDYARTRHQGRDISGKVPGAVPIIRHPDVRRMLLSMKSLTEAARALAYTASASLDLARHHPDAGERERHQRRADLLTPVVKAWCSDIGIEVASTGIQVHGGMGFIEETGAAQHYRDARIAAIYEGTNGIQAIDLVFRKLARDNGAATTAFIGEILAVERQLAEARAPALAKFFAPLGAAREALEAATRAQLDALKRDAQHTAATATPYLRLFGIVAGGYLLCKGALAASLALESGGDSEFFSSRIAVTRFYLDHILPQASALLHTVCLGAASVVDIPESGF
jgi:3-(methylthio)propanoyl-CoA dehydrogenase